MTHPHLTTWELRAEQLGYAPVSDARCPRSLLRKRHDFTKCWCISTLNDHARTWTRQGIKLVLWEPYQAYPEELARVSAAAAEDGLRVIVHGLSPWNPGCTVALEFRVRGVTP